MNHGDRFHAWGMGLRWPGAAGRQCQVWEVTWTAQDESAWSRVLQDITVCTHPSHLLPATDLLLAIHGQHEQWSQAHVAFRQATTSAIQPLRAQPHYARLPLAICSTTFAFGVHRNLTPRSLTLRASTSPGAPSLDTACTSSCLVSV